MGDDFLEGINDRVACHNNAFIRHAFPQQVPAGMLGRGKMQISNHPGNPAVDFLRERLPLVIRPQTCLHVPNPDSVVVAKQGGRHDRCGIALHQHPVRFLGF